MRRRGAAKARRLLEVWGHRLTSRVSVLAGPLQIKLLIHTPRRIQERGVFCSVTIGVVRTRNVLLLRQDDSLGVKSLVPRL